MREYLVDMLAVGFFVLEWAAYALTLEHTAYGRNSLSARMHVYREVWVRRMLDRARWAGSSGQSRLSGKRSAIYSMIASESHTVTSPSIKIGTLPARETPRIRCLSASPV